MKTIRRLLWRDIAWSVAFVAIAFLSLFFFIDFVDELGDVGKPGFSLWGAAMSCLFQVPNHFYELAPIAVLIGAIYAMARLAQSSEFTILRTGGLGPWRALGLLASLGVVFALLTYAVGDYVAPLTERYSAALKGRYDNGRIGRAGAWLKDHRTTPDGERSYSINVQATDRQGELQGVRIYEFDGDGRMVSRVTARTARVDAKDDTWQLTDAVITEWPVGDPEAAVREHREASWRWNAALSEKVVAAAVLPVSTMSTVELWRYTNHLSDQEQASQRYAIQFWKKALYPFACLVMMALALPFAYLHARAGGISLKVFGGIMLGISFVLLNNVASHLGLLRDWTPWLVAAAPSLLFLLMSLGAFAWLVRYR